MDFELQPPPDIRDLAAVKREFAKNSYVELREDVLRRLEYQVGFAQSSLKTLTLVNGGAIIAMFTFIGNFFRDGHALSIVAVSQIRWAFCAFVCGLLCTIGASIAAYFSQKFYMFSAIAEMWSKQAESYGADCQSDHRGPYRTGNRVELIAIMFMVASMLAFAAGSAFALRAVVQMQLL